MVLDVILTSFALIVWQHVLLGLQFSELSWDHSYPEEEGDSHILWLEFDGEEDGTAVNKLLKIYSKQVRKLINQPVYAGCCSSQICGGLFNCSPVARAGCQMWLWSRLISAEDLRESSLLLVHLGDFHKTMQLELCSQTCKTQCYGGNVKKTSVHQQMLHNLSMADHSQALILRCSCFILCFWRLCFICWPGWANERLHRILRGAQIWVWGRGCSWEWWRGPPAACQSRSQAQEWTWRTARDAAQTKQRGLQSRPHS